VVLVGAVQCWTMTLMTTHIAMSNRTKATLTYHTIHDDARPIN
jgi:hypothetical protein